MFGMWWKKFTNFQVPDEGVEWTATVVEVSICLTGDYHSSTKII